MCFVELALNNNNSVDSVIVFYIIPSFTHSSLVLNLSEFLSSAEHKWYFKERGKPNSFWSSVTYIVFFSVYQSQRGPATVSAVYFPVRQPTLSIHKLCCVLTVLAQNVTWFSYQALLDRLFHARSLGVMLRA